MSEVYTLVETSTPLAISGTFTSGTFDTEAYSRIVGSVFSDQAGTLVIEQSYDGINWDIVDTINYSANTEPGISVEIEAPKARTTYTNNATTAQATFRLFIGGRV